MLRIGVTGGIGCGKSTVVNKFINLGVKGYMIDDRSKYLVNTNQDLRYSLTALFGTDVFNVDGTYNTKLVSDIVFKDKPMLIRLTEMFGIYLEVDYKEFLSYNKYEKYVVVESAYFYEYHMENWVDLMVGVEASLDNRIDRVSLRNPNLSVDEIKQRINIQMDQEEKMNRCDYVLNNDNKVEDNEILRLDLLFQYIQKLMKY
jgi:dephospho-CoA kinase